MRKQYWITLGVFSALLQSSPLMAAEEVLIPWAPAVIDSDEQAQTERRARAHALESMRASEENSEEAWMKKFNPEPEDAAAEEKSQTDSRYSPATKTSAKERAGRSDKQKNAVAAKKSAQRNTRASETRNSGTR